MIFQLWHKSFPWGVSGLYGFFISMFSFVIGGLVEWLACMLVCVGVSAEQFHWVQSINQSID
jgi:hypothetical protein